MNMKTFISSFFFLILIFISEISFAQITFQKTYGNYVGGTSVQQTMDGGCILVGYNFSWMFINSYVLLVKTDAKGDTVWTKRFCDDFFGDKIANCVRQTNDSGYIVVGHFSEFGAGGEDIFLIKTDANGDTLWTKTFGGTNDDQAHSVQQTSDGGFIITGSTRSLGAGTFDVFLVKTDVNGNVIWAKTIGDINEDDGCSVQQTSDGGYIIAGSTATNAYLIKIDLNGNLQWSKSFGGPGDEYGFEVQQTTDGGYIITGGTNSFGAGDYDVYLIKSDSTGNLQWSKTFGGTNDDRSYSVKQTSDGGYILAGTTSSFGAPNYNVYLIKTDAYGDSLWTKTFGTGNEFGNSVCQTTEGGFIINGSYGSGGFYVIKTDSLGNSGCNEGTTTTIITNPATQVSSAANIPVSCIPVVTSPTILINTWCPVTTLCSTVGISPTPILPGGEGVSIAPNPFNTSTTLTIPDHLFNDHLTLSIFNVDGRILRKQNITSHQTIMERDGLAAGIYFYKICDKKVVKAVGKLMITN
jgi:hypothetical protein